MPEKMYSPKEAAELLGISERDIRAAVDSGQLRVVPIGKGTVRRRYLITESAIERWQRDAQRVYTQEPKQMVESKTRRRKQEPAIPFGMELDKNGNLRIARKRA